MDELPAAYISAEIFAAERLTWVPIGVAAQLARVHPSTVRRWIKRDRLMETAHVRDRRGRLLQVVWLDHLRWHAPSIPLSTPA